MERYWNDTEMMSKISEKMQELKVSPTAPEEPQPKQKGSKVDEELCRFMLLMCMGIVLTHSRAAGIIMRLPHVR